MKLFIASDIHGSAEYCRKLVDAFFLEQAETLVLLGDLLYGGSQADHVDIILMLNRIADRILCVRGNCDTDSDQAVFNFPMPIQQCLFDLGHTFFLTHGHIYSETCPPALEIDDVLITGHTHIPAWRKNSRFLYLNPGSVSRPRGGSAHSYMTYENGTFQWKTLEGSAFYTYSISKNQ